MIKVRWSPIAEIEIKTRIGFYDCFSEITDSQSLMHNRQEYDQTDLNHKNSQIVYIFFFTLAIKQQSTNQSTLNVYSFQMILSFLLSNVEKYDIQSEKGRIIRYKLTFQLLST